MQLTLSAQECSVLYEAPINGSMECLAGQITDQNCTFRCEPGYELIGSAITVCQPDNTWTYSQPYCTLGDCKPFDPPPNSYHPGSIACSTSFGSSCNTSCVDSYRQIGTNTVQTCVWSDEIKQLIWSEPGIVCESQLA